MSRAVTDRDRGVCASGSVLGAAYRKSITRHAHYNSPPALVRPVPAFSFLLAPTMVVAPAASPVPRIPHLPYGYVPTEWIAILFVVLFALSGSAHTPYTSRIATR